MQIEQCHVCNKLCMFVCARGAHSLPYIYLWSTHHSGHMHPVYFVVNVWAKFNSLRSFYPHSFSQLFSHSLSLPRLSPMFRLMHVHEIFVHYFYLLPVWSCDIYRICTIWHSFAFALSHFLYWSATNFMHFLIRWIFSSFFFLLLFLFKIKFRNAQKERKQKSTNRTHELRLNECKKRRAILNCACALLFILTSSHFFCMWSFMQTATERARNQRRKK